MIKQSGLVHGLLKRPVTVVMVTLMIIGFGLFSLSNLKITLFPSIDIPVVAVSVNYANVAPEDIQRILVEPIENALASLDGVETMDANVRRGGAFIILRLKPGTSGQRVELDAREAIDRIRGSLPREASPPIIFQFDPDNRPIMRMSVEADNRGLDELRNISLELIEPHFERIPGVAQADTRGGLQRNIFVELDPEKLAQYNITTGEIEQALQSNNVQVPVGNLNVGRESYSIRAVSIFQSIDEIGQTIVRTNGENIPLRVNDVATVRDHFADVNTIVEVNGKNSVTVEIQKQSDANTLDVALDVIAAIGELERRLPPGISINVLTNEGQFIENSINNLAQTALVALALVALILFIFMGSYRAAIVVALSIPISMTATFAAMYFTGVTLNIISISGLALAVGLLVDNSIVVLDNIIAKMEQGNSVFDSVLQGTNEMKEALLGSTLTTLGVFIPIFFLEGFIGQIAKDLALTIAYSISLSFLASIILLPVFASKLIKHDSIKTHGIMFRFMIKIEDLYEKMIRWLIVRKWIMAVFVLGIFTGLYFLNANLERENFPESDSGELNINVNLDSGTTLTETAQVISQISNRLMADERVQTVITSVGSSGFRTEPNTGRISVTLVPESQREQSSDEVALEWRRAFQFPNARIGVFVSGGGFGRGGGGWGGGGMGSVRLTLTGPDTDYLRGITNRIEDVMLQNPSVISVDNPRVQDVPELVYRIDREAVTRMGSSFSEVANSFKTQTRGTLVGQYRTGGREYPINVRMDEQYRQGFENLNRLQVALIDEQSIPVSSVGYFEPVRGMNSITRRDRETIMDVNIRVTGNAAEERAQITRFFEEEVVLPEGYRYDFTGSFRDQQDSARQMMFALLAALSLTFMVMAGKFENLRDPFIILFTIPLAFFGAYFFLFITGTPLSSPASIGMLILIGIVVNNGIVLVDYINQTTRHSSSPMDYFDKFVYASRRRVRPIILTMLTTIFSMVPLALGIGEGSETWAPLARAVIGGLFFSSIFTLFIVPVLYVGISRRKRKVFKAVKAKLA